MATYLNPHLTETALKIDLTGKNPDNLIVKEKIIVGFGDNRFLIPAYGAYYAESLQVFSVVGGIMTVIDRSLYTCQDFQELFTVRSGKEVYLSIRLDDSLTDTEYYLTYQAYGGKRSINQDRLLGEIEELKSPAVSPLDWMDVLDKPLAYKPAPHLHLWKEAYGWSHLKRPLDELEQAILANDNSLYLDIISSMMSRVVKIKADFDAKAVLVADDLIDEYLSGIDLAYLGLEKLSNFNTASEVELRAIAEADFDSSTISQDKYINRHSLIAFYDRLKEQLLEKQDFGFGAKESKLVDADKAELLGLANGYMVTIKSQKELVANGGKYEDIYPFAFDENDRFIVIRLTNNINDHGGVFLGFSEKGDMYSGVLSDASCRRPIRWCKFYSEDVKEKLLERIHWHIGLTNNPHHLTKEQVELDKVANFPVATPEEIMNDAPGPGAYITLDILHLFMTKNILNIKAEFKEDGSLDYDTDLFEKPNVIFTPCVEPPKPKYPNKGQLIKTYCDGHDKYRRLADGFGGYIDEISEPNSLECGFKEIPRMGTILEVYCEGMNEVSVVADGRGDSYPVVSEINSEKCGYVKPPDEGEILASYCKEGLIKVNLIANGDGTSREVVIEHDSVDCGYLAPVPEGTPLYEYCSGVDFFRVYADGTWGSTAPMLIEVDSPRCGFFEDVPEGTIVNEYCIGNDYYRDYADGHGGKIVSLIEVFSFNCIQWPDKEKWIELENPKVEVNIDLDNSNETNVSNDTNTDVGGGPPPPPPPNDPGGFARRVYFDSVPNGDVVISKGTAQKFGKTIKKYELHINKIRDGEKEILTIKTQDFPPNALLEFRILGWCTYESFPGQVPPHMKDENTGYIFSGWIAFNIPTDASGVAETQLDALMYPGQYNTFKDTIWESWCEVREKDKEDIYESENRTERHFKVK